MQLSISKASGSGLTQQEEECAVTEKEVDFMDDDQVCEMQQSPNCSSQVELSLKGNVELTAPPPFFSRRMALLQILDLSHTSIKSLPKSVSKLVSLKSLLLRGCQLFMQLSPQVGKLTNLEELDLDETEIMDLPMEIGKLAKLRQLRVAFYQTCGKQKSKWNVLIHPETVSILSQLTELSIDVNPADKRWDDLVEAVVKEVCKSMTLRTLKLYLPKFQLLDNLSWIYPSLPYFRFIVGHHKRRIIHRVPREVEADFRNWDKCLKFVNGENIPIEIQGVLKFSTSFFLDRHSTARNLFEFGVANMRRLKFCLLAECDNMETIIDAENVKDEDPSSLENGLIEFLEYMNIYYMENLTSIWRGPNGFGCMPKLKFLALHTCPRLINIFSDSMLENFVNLEELILEDCPLVTSLASHAYVNPMMSDKFLPSLKRLLLLYLPQLVTISNGLPIAPKLESIGFYNCPKLRSISKMELSSKSLKIIKGESQWWEDMNWDESEWANRPDYLMQMFSPINHEQDVMTQMAEDRDLFKATIQNESKKLDYLEERITETDVTKPSSSGCRVPSSPGLEEPERAWSFSAEKKKLEDDESDLASEISELDDDEDKTVAKKGNYTQNEMKSSITEFANDINHGYLLLNYFCERNQSLNGPKESASKASSVDVTKKSGKQLVRSYNSPCPACKLLRRKCAQDCIFAPYFPADEPQNFANIHKIFGASNVCKLLTDLPTHQREDAVNSLVYEAEMRLKDPVYGCAGVISSLQGRVLELRRMLGAANADSCKEIPTALPACPGASSVEGMNDAYIWGKYDKKPVPVQVQNSLHPSMKMASSSSFNPPCAACKLLRIVCKPGCIFAPYFPADKPQNFANIHKIFGASNVSKLLYEVLPHQRADAMNSLVYEADARVRDPVHGCYGAISSLLKQEEQLQTELDSHRQALKEDHGQALTDPHWEDQPFKELQEDPKAWMDSHLKDQRQALKEQQQALKALKEQNKELTEQNKALKKQNQALKEQARALMQENLIALKEKGEGSLKEQEQALKEKGEGSLKEQEQALEEKGERCNSGKSLIPIGTQAGRYIFLGEGNLNGV